MSKDITGDVDMTIEKGEQLSSFIDGELNREQGEHLISDLSSDEELKACWQRYHIISDAMRSGLPDTLNHEFADKVMSAIESEPAILAPHTPSRSSTKQSLPINKRVAGFAIAASVATLAVIGVQSIYNDESQSRVVATMPDESEYVRMESSAPQVASANPIIRKGVENGFSTAAAVAAANPASTFKHPPIQLNKSLDAVDPKLLKYIVNHSQQVSGTGVQDIFSPARIVSSTQQQGGVNRVQR